jgi:hypothetical protein
VDKVPFTIRRTAKAAGCLEVDIIVTLQDAADEDKREVTTSYSFAVGGGGGGGAAGGTGSGQRIEFVTQTVEFSTDAGRAAAVVGSGSDALQHDAKRQKV